MVRVQLKKPINPKERNLVKGALRRVFSRSELRQQAIDASRTDYTDPDRPRVKKWSLCPSCLKPTPTYLMQVDHVLPIVAVDERLEDMTWDEVVERMWCEPSNLLAICKTCHKAKTFSEAKARRINKGKTKKNPKKAA